MTHRHLTAGDIWRQPHGMRVSGPDQLLNADMPGGSTFDLAPGHLYRTGVAAGQGDADSDAERGKAISNLAAPGST